MWKNKIRLIPKNIEKTIRFPGLSININVLFSNHNNPPYSLTHSLALTKNNQNNIFGIHILLFKIIFHGLRSHKKHPLFIIKSFPLFYRDRACNLDYIIYINTIQTFNCTLLLINERPCWSQKVYLATREPSVVVEHDICSNKSFTQTSWQAYQSVVK